MGILHVPDAQLSYDVIGDGAVLLLIPGANGDAAIFRPMAHALAACYQVVTYDRRGYSRSTFDTPPDAATRLQTDADDVQRLIAHLSERPVTVFGTSSGAIVALEVISRYPEQVGSVIVHEPPAVTLLPDAAEWRATFENVYQTYRTEGFPKAMQRFTQAAIAGADIPFMQQAALQPLNPYARANAVYWMEYELRQYSEATLDLDKLKKVAERIVLLCGRESHGAFTYRPNEVLAQQLGRPIIDVPGAHLGYIAHPTLFAQALMAALGA